MSKIRMQLCGGEQDGLDRELLPSEIPQVFYAVPNVDEAEVNKVKDNEGKRIMRDKLAILAYKYDPVSSTSDLFRMIRTPELDKKPVSS